MKWIKLESNFFQTQTAEILKEEMGYEGVVAFISLMAAIGSEIQSHEDVVHLHEKGWTKTKKNWRKIVSISEVKWEKFATLLQLHSKIDVHLDGIFMTLRFKNSAEFVDERALSSTRRHNTGYPARYPDGPQLGPLDKIRRERVQKSEAALPPPLGEGGHTTAPSEVKKPNARSELSGKKAWKFSEREQAILDRETKRQLKLVEGPMEEEEIEEVSQTTYLPKTNLIGGEIPSTRPRLTQDEIQQQIREALRRDEELRKNISPTASADPTGPPKGPRAASSTVVEPEKLNWGF